MAEENGKFIQLASDLMGAYLKSMEKADAFIKGLIGTAMAAINHGKVFTLPFANGLFDGIKMLKKMVLALFILGTGIIVNAEGEKIYKLNLLVLPGLLDEQNSGIGAEINKEIIKRIQQNNKVKFNIRIFPVKRGVFDYNNNDADALFWVLLFFLVLC